jgi:hydrogenase maturation protein HypF
VLVRRRVLRAGTDPLSSLITPGNPLLGILLPYSPLHHLLMSAAEQPLIATSGNISDEPICIDDAEALARLGGIADMMLVHDRPIVRHADDSIVRIIGGREAVLRRGRGMAPLPVRLGMEPQRTYLAVGAHLKNTIALNVGPSVFISQHIGDLETEQAFGAFKTTVTQLQSLYDAEPAAVIADMHPEYLSTKYAQHLKLPVTYMQHHASHIFSCMAEHRLQDDCFGVSWDGTGYGEDGTIWGGEFFVWKNGTMKRFGTFRSFPLPGGASAIKEPRRTALGLLFELYGKECLSVQEIPSLKEFTPQESETLCRMMEQGLNAPRTSSAGRLFDAVSSLIGLQHRIAYEGQAALALESLADSSSASDVYPFSIGTGANGLHVVDWQEMIAAVIADVHEAIPQHDIARKFHNTMSAVILSMAQKAAMISVVMSGGCFQNALLTEHSISRLKDSGFTPYWHQRVPPNDGGIALGQLYGAVLQERTINH